MQRYFCWTIFRYTTSAVVLQEESGLFTGDSTNRYPIIQKITKDVIAGDWDAVESALREYCRPEFVFCFANI